MIVWILYTNYRGEKAWRRISPRNIYFGETISHPELQWLMEAYDEDKQENRSFAMKDVHEWRTAPPE